MIMELWLNELILTVSYGKYNSVITGGAFFKVSYQIHLTNTVKNYTNIHIFWFCKIIWQKSVDKILFRTLSQASLLLLLLLICERAFKLIQEPVLNLNVKK